MKSPGARLLSITALLIGLLLSACAHEPAFRTTLPVAIDSRDKAIAIIGDLQQTPGFVRFMRRREDNAQAQRWLVDDLEDFVDELSSLVIVGDLVYSARSRRDWHHFDTLVAPFVEAMPVLPAIGNHDYPCIFIEICFKSNISRGMLERFPWFAPGLPYAVSNNDLLLLFLDSESELDSQGAWLEDRLAAAAGDYAAALVFFHRPAFSNSVDPGAVGDPDVKRYVVPRLEQATLPIVAFSGHIHGFEYIVRENVHYVTTAGGGGPRGPLADIRPFDRYRGPDCTRSTDGKTLRPFNYLLLRRNPDRITVEVRGFCGTAANVGTLDTIEIPL